MSNATTIARTILSQVGTNSLMCLGVPPKSIFALPEGNGILGGVEFKFSNCPKVRNGKVRISLMPSDTYRVEIFNQRGTLVKSFDDVYNENLGGQHGVIESVTG